MPGLGLTELLVILAAALLFFGPRRPAQWAGTDGGEPRESRQAPGVSRAGLREDGSGRTARRAGSGRREEEGSRGPPSAPPAPSGGAAARPRAMITDLPPEPAPAATTVPGPPGPPPENPAGGGASGDGDHPDTSIGRKLRELPKNVREDIVWAARSPSGWSAPDWLIRGGIVAGTAGASAWDEELRDAAAANRFDRVGFFRDYIGPLGRTEGQLGVLGAFLAAGKLRNKPQWVDTGMLGVESLVLTAATVLPLKGVIGRQRPRRAEDPFDFSPFSFKNSAFPSGDATSAVAVATVIAGRSGSPWVSGLAYGIAGLVAAGRVYRRRHWLSDAIGGIVLGQMIGRHVLKRHNERTATGAAGREEGSASPPGAA